MSSETPLPQVMVAPNGARLKKADRPALPITLAELITTALTCRADGADGIHLHLRDKDGGHLLDAHAYREAVAQFATELPGFPVQITTEAVGQYDPDHQRQIALNSGTTLVSASVRELRRDSLSTTRDFYEECAARGIALQHILYDVEDADLLVKTLPEHMFGDEKLQLLFVLGRYSADQNADPAALDGFLAWMARHAIKPDWAVCAFGQNETPSLLRAARNGGKCRIGFENSRQHADGRVARDNAERVRELVLALSQQR